MEEQFKFRRVHEISGSFVLAIIALLIAAVLWTGHSQRWFKSRVPLRIILPEGGAAGIRQGSEVYFLGTLVGSVADVLVEPTGRMEAEVNIRRDFFRFVRVDSSAVVKKQFGVAGDSFFEITRGSGSPLPEHNGSIICTDQFQSALESAIEEIHRETVAVLKKTEVGLDTWTKLGSNLDESRQNLNDVLVRLDNITGDVENGKGTVERLIADPTLLDESKRLVAKANQTMDRFQTTVESLNLAVKNVQDGTSRLPEITDGLADEVKNLPGLILQTRSSMTEVERLVEALQKQWLIRKYVNHTDPAPVKPVQGPHTDGVSKNPGKP